MKRILYIGGIGHNGSTMLDIMLGESAKVLSMGQVGALHEYLDGGQCACGEKLSACPLWGKVLAQLDDAEKDQLRKLGPLISGEKNFVRFVACTKLCHLYASIQDVLFRAIFHVSDADVLIDSSKNLSRAVALLRASKYNVCFLHLVRDPRGYVNSVNKRRRERGKEPRFMTPMVQWTIKNGVASTIVRAIAKTRYLRISYEELMLHPQEVVKRIGKFVDCDFSDTLSHIEQRQPFHRKHIFSGNRVSQSNAVIFDPSRIQDNRLKYLDNKRFWLLGGWISAFWGYDRDQVYLSAGKDWG